MTDLEIKKIEWRADMVKFLIANGASIDNLNEAIEDLEKIVFKVGE